MGLWESLTPGDVAYLVVVVIGSVTVAVVGLVAIGAAEARSRRGEAERVAVIRARLRQERQHRRSRLGDRQPVGMGDRGRS